MEELKMTKLTAMEIKMMNAMRNNEYQDSLVDGGTWTFTVIDNSGISGKKASGVISSLVQKGLVTVFKEKGEEDTISFTTAGKQLYDTADGAECTWGGLPLLTEKEMEIKEIAPAPVTQIEETVTLNVKDLAAMMGIDEKSVRRKLRKSGLVRNGKTWELQKTQIEGLK